MSAEEQLSQAKSENETLNSRVSALTNELTEAEARCSGLERDAEALRAEILQWQQKQTSSTDEIARLNNDHRTSLQKAEERESGLRKQLADAQREIADLRKQITDQDNTISRLKSEVERLRRAVEAGSAVQDELRARAETAERALAQANTSLAQMTGEQKVRDETREQNERLHQLQLDSLNDKLTQQASELTRAQEETARLKDNL